MKKSALMSFNKSVAELKTKGKKSSSGTSSGESLSFSEAELFGQLRQAIGPTLFLDRFTPAEIVARMEAAGFWSALKEKMKCPPRLRLQHVQPDEHRLLVLDDSESEPARFIELRLSLARMEIPNRHRAGATTEPFEMLAINWAMLQDPRARFSPERPRLPGQEHPGLGLGRKCQIFLIALGRELRQSGLINHPQFFHNAVFYQNEYYFVAPELQGALRAMIRDLAKYPIDVASRAIEEGRLWDAVKHCREEWKPDVMVCPIRRRLKKYFEDPAYRKAVQAASASHAYDLAE